MNKQNKTKQLLKFMKVFNLSWDVKLQIMSIILIVLFLALQRVILEKNQKYILLETGLSWVLCNINLWASLDRFSGRHRDL